MNERSGRGRFADSRHATLPATAAIAPAQRRVLETALRLFASDGFHATSMRDLAKALDIQPSALYAVFPAKDHVLAELVRVGHEIHLAALRAALLEGGNDPLDQLRAVVRANALVHIHYPHLAVIVNDEMHALPADLLGPGLALRRQGIAMLLAILERGITLKRFAPHHPTATAAAIGAMSLRIPYWYEASSELTPDQLATLQVELAVRMVEVRP